ncbi:hypothetical protein [Algoriphagus namhaensis]
MKLKTTLNFVFGLVVSSCGFSDTKEEGQIADENRVEIKIDSLRLDTIFVSAKAISQVGFFFFLKDGIGFSDRIQSKVYEYDFEGNFKGSFLGTGEGPDRQNGTHGIVVNEDKLMVLSDRSISSFDSTYVRQNRLNLDWGGEESHEEMLHAPSPEMFGLYEITWISREANMPFIVLEEEQGFILPVMMTHPELNGYWTTEYYETVPMLGLFDQDFKLQKLGGLRSKEYLNYQYLPNFDYIHLEQKGDSLLVCFPIDPLIHIYDLNFNFLGTFGERGKSMKTDYIPTQTLEEAESQWETDFLQFGHYDDLFYDEKQNLVFRTYLPQGKGNGSSRLQIYRNETLIGDLEVPIRFRVLGSKDGVFYADGIVEEENEVLAFYRFTLNEN